ncbi:hypothetical protein LR010_03145 [Candidatus Gracilibacteria bacterium]|nr:hypothetical protein [Candidatus Gracilibacteria bacterium]
MHFGKFLFIIGVLSVSASQVSALTYNDELPVNSSFKEVSDVNTSAAKLLQDYVESYGEKINSLLDSYASENTEIITLVNSSLKQMSRSLDIIQYKSVDPDVVNSVIKSVVSDLKTINNKMKVYLEQERQLYLLRLETSKNTYIRIASKISEILDNLIDTISHSLVQKESLSEKEKTIVRSLVIIREQNNKIKDFKNISFSSRQEMKQYFQDIIFTIKGEINSMK